MGEFGRSLRDDGCCHHETTQNSLWVARYNFVASNSLYDEGNLLCDVVCLWVGGLV